MHQDEPGHVTKTDHDKHAELLVRWLPFQRIHPTPCTLSKYAREGYFMNTVYEYSTEHRSIRFHFAL